MIAHAPGSATQSPRGRYSTVTLWDKLAFVAGHVSRASDGQAMRGCLENVNDVPRGEAAARAAADACLKSLETRLGSLDAVACVLSVRGFLAATPTFEHHSQVLDAASARIIEVLAERGRHTRAVVGVTSLPSGGVVEIELVVGLR